MRPRPGHLIVQPVPLAALVLLALNDHAFKAAWPGPLTGKLSDVAGLILLPFYLAAAAEVVAWIMGRHWRTSKRGFVILAAVTGIAFALVKLVEPANRLYEVGFGMARWAAEFPVAAALGSSLGSPQPVVVVTDASDLIALPVLIFATWSGARIH